MHTLAKERGLFLADAQTAAGYAKGFPKPVIVTITPTITPQVDTESGIGAHFQVPADTPVLIRSVHEINQEYLTWDKHIKQTEIPNLVKVLKEHFRSCE